jgi:hypothetical protein
LPLNPNKANTIQFITNNSPQHALNIGYIEMLVKMKFLVLQIEKHQNWTNHINKLIPNLSGALYEVKSMCHVSNTDTLNSV